MLPYFSENLEISLNNHDFGRNVNNVIDQARKEIADLIKARLTKLFSLTVTESIILQLKALQKLF